MNSHPYGFQDLHDRLLHLEKQNRRFKRLGVAVLIVPTLLLVMGQAPSKKTVEANEFILRDASGNVRARLSMSDKAAGTVPEMVLFDDNGNKNVRMTGGIAAQNIGGGISIFDSRGQERGTFAETNGGAILTLLDNKGNNRGIFSFSDADNSPFLSFFDSAGILRSSFSAKNDGASLSFYDSKQIVRGTFTAGQEDGFLYLADSKGSMRAALMEGAISVRDDQGFEATMGEKALETPRTGETHKTSAASLVLFDKNKNVIWKAP